MPYIATHQGRTTKVKITEPRPGIFNVVLGDKEYSVDFLEPEPNIFSMIVGGRSFEVDVDATHTSDVYDVYIKGDQYEIEMIEEKKKKLAMKMNKGVTGRQDIKAPMAGNVVQVLVVPGDRVAIGQVLLILEAMKMQNELKSPIDGVVASVTARQGVAVAAGDPLCVVEPWELEFPVEG